MSRRREIESPRSGRMHENEMTDDVAVDRDVWTTVSNPKRTQL